MKTKLFFILFVTALCVGFTSCSDDDDDDYAKDIQGDYKGTITVMQVPSNATIGMVYKSENKITLKFKEEVLTFPIDISLDADVSKKDGVYAINATGKTANPTNPEEEVDVVVDGIVKNDVATINIKVDVPMLAEISVDFTGTKQ